MIRKLESFPVDMPSVSIALKKVQNSQTDAPIAGRPSMKSKMDSDLSEWKKKIMIN